MKLSLLSPVAGRPVITAQLSIPPLNRRLERALESGDRVAEWLRMDLGEEDEGSNEERFRKTAVPVNCDRAEIHRD